MGNSVSAILNKTDETASIGGHHPRNSISVSKDSLIPIPIDKNDSITKPEAEKSDMKLMQQYIMVAGKLQPALKYKVPNPMFNRYSIENGVKDKYEEIVTYPTVSGDLKMANKHQGVNFDDRDIPAK